MNAVCVECRRVYDTATARAEFKGLCSMKCQHDMARSLGFRKGKDKSEYAIIHIELRERRNSIVGADRPEA
jgi:hypothetical protein